MEKTIRVLNAMKTDGIVADYAIAGAIAATFWAEPLTTYDLDVFVVLSPAEMSKPVLTLNKVYSYLAKKGYKAKAEPVEIEGIPVQFLPVYDALVAEATAGAVKLKYGHEAARVVGPEHLLAIMASVGRPKDKSRIAQMLDSVELDRKRLADILRRHALLAKWRAAAGTEP